MVTQQKLPALYSFRRCPYAIRARLAIDYSGVSVEMREVRLRDKPIEMLTASPKGTVPILTLTNGKVIDESLDVMFWALKINDPTNLLSYKYLELAKKLIMKNDTFFKPRLDKYKYSTRFPECSSVEYRQKCGSFLVELEQRLSTTRFLMCSELTIADLAIFPFIRQFASVDKSWFQSSIYINLKVWLEYLTQLKAFERVMFKHEIWHGRSS